MPTLGMEGPYELTSEKVDEVVTKTSAGNYALGRVANSTFYVRYVGRSDSDVNRELKSKLGRNYSMFKFSYANSPKEAFEKECRNYHDFGESEKLDNERHPDRPDGTDWKCPRCDIFG